MPATREARLERAERTLTLTRLLDAPRELVWAAWTDPTQMARWWGPNGFTNPVCEMDVRVGGAIRIDMRSPDGTVHPMTGTFREVLPPERLVFAATPIDHDGNVLLESLTTVTFEAVGQKTKLTVHASAAALAPAAARMLAGMEAGWSQSLDRLAAMLAETSRSA